MNKKKNKRPLSEKTNWFKKVHIKRNVMPYPPSALKEYLRDELCYWNPMRHKISLRRIANCTCIACGKEEAYEEVNWASVCENVYPHNFIDTRDVINSFDYDQKTSNSMTDGRCYVCKECGEIIFVPAEDTIFDSYEIHEKLDKGRDKGIPF